MNRILVLRGGALGDFLVTLPFLRALRARWSDARIELVGNQRAAELAVLGGILSVTHGQAEARWARLYSAEPLSGDFRSWLETFDLVISFWPDPDKDLAQHFPLRPEQRFIVGGATVTTQPASDHFFRAFPELGWDAAAQFQRLEFAASFADEVNSRLDLTRAPIALHPGSGSAVKNWPIENWRKLVEALSPHPVLLILGEADDAARAEFAATEFTHVQRVDSWPLPLLASALSRCRLFVGHDTGVSHLSAAMGTPSLLLFGPTDSRVWAPRGDHVRVLNAGDALVRFSVERVLAAISEG